MECMFRCFRLSLIVCALFTLYSGAGFASLIDESGVVIQPGEYLRMGQLRDVVQVQQVQILDQGEQILGGGHPGQDSIRLKTTGSNPLLSWTPKLSDAASAVAFANAHRWLTLEMSASAGRSAQLTFSRDGHDFPEVIVPVVADGLPHRYAVDLNTLFFGMVQSASLRPGTLLFDHIALMPTDVADADVTIYRMGFGPTPLGTGMVQVSRIGLRPATPRIHDDVHLDFSFQNIGGETVKGVRAQVSGSIQQKFVLPLIAPGQTVTHTVPYLFADPGEHNVHVQIDGGHGKEMTSTIRSDRQHPTQWVMQQLTFQSETTYENPFDMRLSARFEGPNNVAFDIPGFYNGNSTWNVRFSPTEPGEWTFVTKFSDKGNERLHDQRGTFEVAPAPAEGDNPLFVHGGFLRVSENKRYLTYSDGTPFFWLGDTWWFCPSDLCPLNGSSNPHIDSMYKTIVDKRREQGYSVIQMAFLGDNGVINDTIDEWAKYGWNESQLEYWQEVDEYLAYANDAGLLPVIGLAFHTGMDRLTLDQWKEIWSYVVARYGSYAVSWLITGEYNLYQVEDRIEKAIGLGQAIKDMDPYKRAMSVHSVDINGGDRGQAWDEPWYDFIIMQAGHGRGANEPRVISEKTYLDAYNRDDIKPLLESEANYEGINSMGDDSVRLSAYRAIQLGSFGFTYGAHGLWYPTQNPSDPKFADWGVVKPWWEALHLLGGAQMQHLRNFYESIEWWELEPRPDLIVSERRLADRYKVLAKVQGDERFVIYFPPGLPGNVRPTLKGMNPELTYTAKWFDPRTGEPTAYAGDIVLEDNEWMLPERWDREDWLLLIEAN